MSIHKNSLNTCLFYNDNICDNQIYDLTCCHINFNDLLPLIGIISKKR